MMRSGYWVRQLFLFTLLTSTCVSVAQDELEQVPPEPASDMADGPEIEPDVEVEVEVEVETEAEAGPEAEPAPDLAPSAMGMPESTDGLPQLPPRDAFDAILQRPLFASNRRPEQVATSNVSESELRDNWRLTGIVLMGDEPRALFAERNGERRLRLYNGMPLDGSWVLGDIRERSVVLSSGDQEVEMQLFAEREALIEPTPSGEEAPSQEEGETTEEGEQAPASIEERTPRAVQRLRERIEATTGGTQ